MGSLTESSKQLVEGIRDTMQELRQVVSFPPPATAATAAPPPTAPMDVAKLVVGHPELFGKEAVQAAATLLSSVVVAAAGQANPA